jgi:protein involved in ribonucleotide reduction
MMKNSKRTTTIFLTVLFIFALFPGSSISANGNANKEDVKQQKNPYANAEITIKIIPSTNKTFGYDILLYGKPLVHQPNIPALPGHEGFSTKEKAQTVAEFVVEKIRKNEMPPTVTIEDLNKMGVLE